MDARKILRETIANYDDWLRLAVRAKRSKRAYTICTYSNDPLEKRDALEFESLCAQGLTALRITTPDINMPGIGAKDDCTIRTKGNILHNRIKTYQ